MQHYKILHCTCYKSYTAVSPDDACSGYTEKALDEVVTFGVC